MELSKNKILRDLSVSIGALINLLLTTAFFVPLYQITIKHTSLVRNSTGVSFQTSISSFVYFAVYLWDISREILPFSFLIFIILGLTALILSYLSSKYSSFAWFVLLSSIFTFWMTQYVGTKIAGSASILLLFLTEKESNLLELNSSSPFDLWLFLILLLSVLVLGIELFRTYLNKSELDFGINPNLLTFIFCTYLFLPLSLYLVFHNSGLITLTLKSMLLLNSSFSFARIVFAVITLTLMFLLWFSILAIVFPVDKIRETIQSRLQARNPILLVSMVLPIGIAFFSFVQSNDVISGEPILDITTRLLFFILYLLVSWIFVFRWQTIKQLPRIVHFRNPFNSLNSLSILLLMVFSPLLPLYLQINTQIPSNIIWEQTHLTSTMIIDQNKIFNNGTITFKIHPRTENYLFGEKINVTNYSFRISTIFADFGADTNYSTRLEIETISSSDNTTGIDMINETIDIGESFISLKVWTINFYRETKLKISFDENNSFLNYDNVSIAFCYPDIASNYVSTAFERYKLLILVEGVILEA